MGPQAGALIQAQAMVTRVGRRHDITIFAGLATRGGQGDGMERQTRHPWVCPGQGVTLARLSQRAAKGRHRPQADLRNLRNLPRKVAQPKPAAPVPPLSGRVRFCSPVQKD
jgi:hypothetical protein